MAARGRVLRNISFLLLIKILEGRVVLDSATEDMMASAEQRTIL